MNWKKIGKRMLHPHPLSIGLVLLAATALLLFGARAGEGGALLSGCSYALFFYLLVVISLRVPKIVRFGKRFKRENKYAARYVSDVRLRVNISLHVSLLFNSVYAVFQLGLGIWHRSIWFYAMAGYYFLLAGMRLLLAKYTRNYGPGERQTSEWRRYRMCGVVLLLITFALMVFILYFVWEIRVFKHHEITTIAMATYSFAYLILAIVNVIRYRSYGSPAYSAAKTISLVSALVSMLTLENTMLTVFDRNCSAVFRQRMLGISGVAVIAAVQTIALYMIIHAGKQLRKIRRS